MKLLFIILATMTLASCSSAPTKYLRENCESVDVKGQACPLNSLCYCENVPKDAREGGRRP